MWVDHVHKVYPDSAEHIIRWLAHRVQRPAEKINHALVLGGSQGIGKDTLLEPAKYAVGPWNVAEISPTALLGRFNGFLKSVILRVSEAHDLGEFNRFALYERLKAYTAAPPDGLRVDEKNLREYTIPNCCGVVITSNHQDALFLPADDRRHYVAWSELTKDSFVDDYWRRIWGWYDAGGLNHVAAYLGELDLAELRPQGAAAEDPGVLADRQHRQRARGRRARRPARQAGQPRRRHAGAAARQGRRELRRVAVRSAQPPRHPPPDEQLRLRAGAQPERRRRPVADPGGAPGHLRQGRAVPRRALPEAAQQLAQQEAPSVIVSDHYSPLSPPLPPSVLSSQSKEAHARRGEI